MNTIISARHASPGYEAKQYAIETSEKLARYFRRVLTIEWKLEAEGVRRVVTCRVHALSGFYRVRVAADGFRKAIHDAEQALVRQRRRRKEVRLKIRSRSGTISVERRQDPALSTETVWPSGSTPDSPSSATGASQ